MEIKKQKDEIQKMAQQLLYFKEIEKKFKHHQSAETMTPHNDNHPKTVVTSSLLTPIPIHAL